MSGLPIPAGSFYSLPPHTCREHMRAPLFYLSDKQQSYVRFFLRTNLKQRTEYCYGTGSQ